jgi:GDP-L-fucose synthase
MIDFSNDIGVPDMSYGWAKLTCEYLARLAYDHHGVRSVTYRPFSGYGEDQDDSYPFPSICKRAIAQRSSPLFTVWGSGRQMRDFIHIVDCVRGVIETTDKVENGDAINLSTGKLTSFIEFANMATAICGYIPDVRGTADRPEGVFACGGDTTRQIELGFLAEVAFRTGIQRALHWLEMNGSRYISLKAVVPSSPTLQAGSQCACADSMSRVGLHAVFKVIMVFVPGSSDFRGLEYSLTST